MKLSDVSSLIAASHARLPRTLFNAIVISAFAIGCPHVVHAADLAQLPAKAKPVFDVPFFFVNDNRLTYAYEFTGSDPGAGRTAKQVVALTHFDAWAYGTNFINLELLKSDQRDPASPCPIFQQSGCAGSTEFYGIIRSTFGFNQVFGTKAFTMGPLHNVSLEVGGDSETQNIFAAPNKKSLVAGIQFAFDLPYQGYFNAAPLYYQEWNHNTFTTPAFMGPGYSGIIDGNTRFDPTWAFEINYYMDLGFLPASVQYFAISGRAGFYGPKGTGAASGALPQTFDTKMEINSEPIRLTLDASRAIWGDKYAHFMDVWVAYRYWKNKFGVDDGNPANTVCFTGGVNNHSCSEQSFYTGVSVKF